MKFKENPFNRSRIVKCGRTGGQTDEKTDVTKLKTAFLKSTNEPKNRIY